MNDNNKNNKLYVCYSLTSCKKDNISDSTHEVKQQHKDYKIAVSNKDKAMKWVNARREEYAQYRRLKTKGERNSFMKKHPLLEKTMLYGNDVGYEELEVLE
ncbi:MAG: hypothetical protein ACJ70R_08085 [Nitrososphaera sp.]